MTSPSSSLASRGILARITRDTLASNRLACSNIPVVDAAELRIRRHASQPRHTDDTRASPKSVWNIPATDRVPPSGVDEVGRDLRYQQAALLRGVRRERCV